MATPVALPTAATGEPTTTTPAWEILTARGHVLRVHRGMSGAELAVVLAALDISEARR